MFATRLAVLCCLIYCALTAALAAAWTAACACSGFYVLIPHGFPRLTIGILAAAPLFAIWLASFAIACALAVRRAPKQEAA